MKTDRFSLLALCFTLALCFAANARAQSFGNGNLVVYRVGDGSAALTSAATVVFLDEYATSGAFVRSIMMPTSASGSNKILTASGSATSEGLLSRSPDGKYIVLTGYNASLGTMNPNTATASSVNRVVGIVNGAGSVDTTTALTDAASSSNIRSATTNDGTNIWVAGGAGGVRYATKGATTSTQLSTTVTNLRQVNIFANQLYVSTTSGTTIRVGSVGTGLPTTSGQTITNLPPNFPTSTGSPNAFYFAHLNSAASGSAPDTVYVADDAAGQIQKFTLSGGVWNQTGAVNVTGVRGLTATIDTVGAATTVTLYATTASSLVKVADASGYGGTLSGSPTTLASAATNTAFRSVALAPVSNPTVANVEELTATAFRDGALIEWRTGFEFNNLGFRIYREREGARSLVTSQIIAGSALTNGANAAAQPYAWFDPNGAPGDLYYLEDIYLNGDAKLSAPALAQDCADESSDEARARKRRAQLLSQIGAANETQRRAAGRSGATTLFDSLASRTSNANSTLLKSSEGAGGYETNAHENKAETEANAPSTQAGAPSPQLLTQWRIAAQRAVKIGVKRDGWYRIARADLIANGLDANVSPHLLQLYADGIEQPIIVSNENSGAFGANDYIEFYGTAIDTPSADTHVYYLIVGSRQGKRITAPVRRRYPTNISSNRKTTEAKSKRVFEAKLSAAIRSGVEQEVIEGGAIQLNEAVISDDASFSDASRVQSKPSKGAQIGRVSPPPPSAANSFAYTIERKDRTIFFGGLLADGDSFFGPIINSTPLTQTLTVSNLDGSGRVTLQIALQGVTYLAHQVKVNLNGTDLGVVNFQNQENHVETLSVPAGVVREGANAVTLTAVGAAANNQTDVELIDFMRINYAHFYRADNDALAFSAKGAQRVRVDGFTKPNLRVVDITNPTNVFEIAPRIEAGANGYALSFDAPFPTSQAARTLYAFVDGTSQQPAFITANQPSTLSSADMAADFVIIAHHDFLGAVEPLKNLRQSQGLATTIVDVEDIYDEFSFGVRDPQAITEFFRYATQNWRTHPRFALLVGDSTYDPRNYLGLGADFVPTKLIVTAYSKTSSDDALAEFNGDGLAALAIGRLPARTAQEAQQMISKILNYAPSANAQNALFVADYRPDYCFSCENDALRPYLPQSLNVQAINKNDATSDVVRSRIVDALNAGPLVMNYSGHGSFDSLDANILTTSDAAKLNNGTRLPLVTMMTCLTGYFQDPSYDCLAESLLKAQNGGAIAVWASSGLTVPTSQTVMNTALYRALFSSESGYVGELMLKAKTATDDRDVRRTWILFGDPTQRVK